MTAEQIVDYVMHTPHNTNRQVLEQMLEELVDSAYVGSGDTFDPAEPGEGPDDLYIIFDGGPAEGWHVVD